MFFPSVFALSSVQLDGIRVKKKDPALISMDQVLLIQFKNMDKNYLTGVSQSVRGKKLSGKRLHIQV